MDSSESPPEPRGDEAFAPAILHAGFDRSRPSTNEARERRQPSAEVARLPAIEPGSVWLVGAGPGDPGLLSRLAARALETADAVLHDRWIEPAILGLMPAGCYAEALPFADPARADPAAAAERAVQLAREGWRVARLMDGDPFGSGQGAAEALAIAAAGIPFRVVPGILARISGLAYAGVPLSHGGAPASVAFFDLETGAGDLSDLAILFRFDGRPAGLLVFRLRPDQLPALARRLRASRLDPQTPAVLVARPGSAEQRVVDATAGELAAQAAALADAPRLILAIGENVRLRRRLSWMGKTAGAGTSGPANGFSMAGFG
jgi:uroporphyrin-III C-methyltransferase